MFVNSKTIFEKKHYSCSVSLFISSHILFLFMKLVTLQKHFENQSTPQNYSFSFIIFYLLIPCVMYCPNPNPLSTLKPD